MMMDKSKYKYKGIASDETTNSKGFITRTRGIDLNRYDKNGIILSEHDYDMPIGMGIAEAVDTNLMVYFNLNPNSELAKKIEVDIDGKFLRGLSIRIAYFENDTEIINGIKYVNKCELREISVVTIPSNGNTVLLSENGECKQVTEVIEDGNTYCMTSLNFKINKVDKMEEILKSLNIESEEVLLSNYQELEKKATELSVFSDGQAKDIEELKLQLKVEVEAINETLSKKESIIKDLSTEVLSLTAKLNEYTKSEVEKLAENAILSGSFGEAQRTFLIEIGLKDKALLTGLIENSTKVITSGLNIEDLTNREPVNVKLTREELQKLRKEDKDAYLTYINNLK